MSIETHLSDLHTGGESVIERVRQPSCPYRLAVGDLQYARQQQELQDEDKRPQLDRNSEGNRALLFTKEKIDAGFGIWDAGMSLSATIVTGSHVQQLDPQRLARTIRVTMTNLGVGE